jgi:hypothetical protein
MAIHLEANYSKKLGFPTHARPQRAVYRDVQVPF